MLVLLWGRGRTIGTLIWYYYVLAIIFICQYFLVKALMKFYSQWLDGKETQNTSSFFPPFIYNFASLHGVSSPKDVAVKMLHSICQQKWKTQQWPQVTGKSQFSFQSQRRAIPKNVQTTTQLHSSHKLVK